MYVHVCVFIYNDDLNDGGYTMIIGISNGIYNYIYIYRYKPTLYDTLSICDGIRGLVIHLRPWECRKNGASRRLH